MEIEDNHPDALSGTEGDRSADQNPHLNDGDNGEHTSDTSFFLLVRKNN